ncbi:hypothetical protein SPBR_09240 [Sporothrix brasiliensis 5110]|uniref:Uncharacterized protein n=1 Tax=Sporothrix brasiliensis 5110 TaxID=1398154 RepID=A0A0C2J750_9PEZI|nr:uncharacterized protein SPBR_09240 [Sporothrix brasiliensis 5110]KIH94825.1 hypothetical protein SPBR_09240 [Sporothrix brasiliensis 5110]
MASTQFASMEQRPSQLPPCPGPPPSRPLPPLPNRGICAPRHDGTPHLCSSLLLCNIRKSLTGARGHPTTNILFLVLTLTATNLTTNLTSRLGQVRALHGKPQRCGTTNLFTTDTSVTL